jgi:hypothetical protein
MQGQLRCNLYAKAKGDPFCAPDQAAQLRLREIRED